jgi:hypothetical protein
MSTNHPLPPDWAKPLPPDDRRQASRYALTLLGRFMRATKQEYPCKVVDISLNGASIMSPVMVEKGEKIVAYFDHIGALEGHVVRRYEGGFAMSLAVTPARLEKLEQRLEELISRGPTSPGNERRQEIRRAANDKSLLTLVDGSVHECRISDISITGAAVETTLRPLIGALVTLGKQRARCVRHTTSGIAVLFLDTEQIAAPAKKIFG